MASVSPVSTPISEPDLSNPDVQDLVRDTLITYISENGRCLYCDQVIGEERVPKTYCSDNCLAATTTIGVLLGLALTPGQDRSTAAMIGLRHTAAEKALNVMAVVITHCSHYRTRRETRKLFQHLQKGSSLKIIPRCLFMDTTGLHIEEKSWKKGGFGRVDKCRYHGQLVAVKYMLHHYDDDDNEVYRQFLYEVMLWKSIKHKRVLSLLGVVGRSPEVGMVSPLCEDNHVNDFLKHMVEHHERFRWTRFYRIFVYRWLLQIAEGLDHLHSEGIVHGDLHPWNILVTRTRSESMNPFDIDILITDFGLSIYHEDNSGDNGSLRGGRPSFRAPELHNKRITGTTRPTQESDSFAWAASAYNLFTTKIPYSDKYSLQYGQSVIGDAIVEGELPSQTIGVKIGEMFYSVLMPSELWEIVTHCWKYPNDRITVKEVIARLKPMQREYLVDETK